MALLICVITAAPVFGVSPSDVSGTDVSSTDASSTDVSSADVSGSDTSGSDAPSAPIYNAHNTQQPMRDITAADLADEINIGWCLGETLDSWSSDAGYNSFYNSNAYQMVIRYDDAKGYRSTSIANTFKQDNTCTFTWQTGLIESEALENLGDIGFEIWNFAFDEATTIKVKCTEAHLVRRNKQVIDFDGLLGEHEVTISKYGTGAVLTDQFPDNISHTTGITDGTFKVTVELVDFPQKTYSKEQFFETLWNNPITTQEMINAVKEKGFNAIRVPVTYFNHTAKDTYKIDDTWLDRVQEVVDYIVSQDMYCIIDMHNDGSTSGWLRVNPATSSSDVASSSDVINKRFDTLWQQIADRFKHYDEHLIFQDFNEITDTKSTWTYPGEDKIKFVNQLNQRFVDAVRATGSNNATRCLMVAPYSGTYEADVIKGFKLPNDTVENRLIAAVNCYYPADFSWELETSNDTSYTDVVEWGSTADVEAMDSLFAGMNDTFVSQGIPLCIVAFGSDDKGNDDARIAHARHFVSTAAKYKIPCFWWDDGDMFLRKTLDWIPEGLAEALIDTTSIHVDNLDYEITGDCWYTGSPIEPGIVFKTVGYDIGGGTQTAPATSATDGAAFDENALSLTERIKRFGMPEYDESSKVQNVLMEGEDYTIVYHDNTEIGTASVTITGRGKFSGIRTIEFKIKEKPSAVANLLSFGSDDPDIPLIVMLSVPLLCLLGGLAIYQTIQRRERDRVAAVIAESLEDARRPSLEERYAARPDEPRREPERRTQQQPRPEPQPKPQQRPQPRQPQRRDFDDDDF